MPYIAQGRRSFIEPMLIELGKHIVKSGELNYAFTILAREYMKKHRECYDTHNDIIGAFENAKNEWQRRQLHPFEDLKRAANGDVYEKGDPNA